MSTALALRPAVTLEWTPEQRQLIRDTYANGASNLEFAVLLETARVWALNPFLRQIYFVQRYDSEKGRKVWAVQVAIDGLRVLAERTGLYAGQDEPEYQQDKDGRLLVCKVRVYRKDWQRPAVGVAYWGEYAQTTKDGRVTRFWADKPHVMLAKCAEAIALRKAFPEQMSGAYAPEEFGRAEVEIEGHAEIEAPTAPQLKPACRVEREIEPALQSLLDSIEQMQRADEDGVIGPLTLDVAATLFLDHQPDWTQEQTAEAFKLLLSKAAPKTSAADLKRHITVVRAETEYSKARSKDEIEAIRTEIVKKVEEQQFPKSSPLRARLERVYTQALGRFAPPDGPRGGKAPANDAHVEPDAEREAIAYEGTLVSNATAWVHHLANEPSEYAVAGAFYKRVKTFIKAGVADDRQRATVDRIAQLRKGGAVAAARFLREQGDKPVLRAPRGVPATITFVKDKVA